VATVLLIDDDVQFRKLAGHALRAAGHDLVEAGRASEAESKLATLRPDLVIIDGLLPDADGAVWIAKRRKTIGAPYIFTSAFWKGPRDERFLKAEVKPAGFLRKPASPEQIQAEVARVLGDLQPALPSGADVAGFEALRSEYVAELPERLARLHRQLASMEQRPRDPVLFAEARSQAHELAGTAGSFGYDELTALGNELERALLSWKANSNAAAWAPIARAMGNLEWWQAACLPVPGANPSPPAGPPLTKAA
jgi:DNA-binding response OmpR family regulator